MNRQMTTAIAGAAPRGGLPANDVGDVLAERVAALLQLPNTIEQLRGRLDRIEHAIELLTLGDPDQLLDTEQAAALLGMSEAAVRQAARRGTLPAEYKGRRLRFRRSAILGSLGPKARRSAR
jgi:excisionase family DNA binding protein